MTALSGKLPDDAASATGSRASNSTAQDVSRTNTNDSALADEKDVADAKDIADAVASKDIESGEGAVAEQPVLAGKKMFGVMIALALSMFLAALDNTIVSTMLPKITEKFEALTLMTWIVSSYVVASTALQPIYGKLCHIYGHQYVLLVAHAFFLVGSVVCGASKSAHMLIAGRTIAGVGGSGLMSMCFVVVGDFVPTARSPLYLSVFAMVWAVASVVGPLLGGVFADKTGFEWGFYINPCIQGVVIVLIVLFMRIPRPHGSGLSKLKRIDFIGIFAVVSGIVLLQLGITWGGQDYPWKSAAVIVTMILGILILVGFVIIEWKLPAEPVMPLRLFKRRNTSLMFISQVFFGMSFFLPIFYFPLYLSVVKNASAISSGLHLISCVLAISLSSIASGILITKTGIYLPFIWAGVALNTAGTGLFTLLGSNPSNGMLIGIPIVFGAGVGLAMQPMLFCAQNSVEQQDIATTTTLFMTIRMLGSAIGLAIAQSVMQNEISPLLKAIAAKFPDHADVVLGIVSNQSVIWDSQVPTDVRDATIDAYVSALHKVYLVFLAFGGLTFVVSLFAKNLGLRKNLGGAAAE
ncbi:hypothetical protein H4S02_004506 [Coemansia sp. RSA 2611]|nr:hypothetical protein IWW54_001501 [Coemansia sp. RSA 2705]KAJ2320521.1 hypothetical protein IWW52_001314 [Coemansia sp. RSA 2704]KAJ2364215.1 hypothetical protein H4S01_003897 [Coemansia sp. RSA 2610]KAJ2385088.1 hypothetical protein H4S02_004506 [Coemansia sp. RSA 2611]